MSRDSLGRHVLVEFFGCSPEILNDVVAIEHAMLTAAEKAGATIINSTFHHFSPFGVSGVVVVQESHLAIHTWPEYGYAAVDIFTCGEPVDPWAAYHYLKKALEADSGAALEMHRGQLDILSKYPGWELSENGYPQQVLSPTITRNVWFTERHEYIAQSFRHRGDVVYRKQSDYQRIEIYDTYAYGKMMVLDGIVQTSEKDEFIYHEMIVHPAMQLLGEDAERILIVGGGDGGTVRELCRYTNVKHIDVVEIDQEVVEAARKYLPSISYALDDDRVHIHHADGIKFVHSADSEHYDLVIVDSSDPVGPSKGLFSTEFHRNIYRILENGGIMIAQSESPFFKPDLFIDFYDMLEDIYSEEKVFPYFVFIPTYPTGMWSFAMAIKGDRHPIKDFDAEKARQFVDEHRLRYYNSEIHTAAFAMPNFVKEMLDVREHV